MVNRNLTSGYDRSVKKLSLQCFFRSIIVSFMAFLLYASFTIIVSGMTTTELGYTIMFSKDAENFEDVYTHYHNEDCFDEDGCDDPKYNDYAENNEYYKSPIRSEVSEKATVATRWVGQTFALAILWVVIYSVMWKAGEANADAAELGGGSLDKKKGFLAGIFADIPYALLWLGLVFYVLSGSGGTYSRIFKIATYFMFAFNDTFIPVGANGLEVTLGGAIATAVVLLPIPIITSFAYKMGQRHIILKDKIVYKNEER